MMQGDSYSIPFEIKVDGIMASESTFADVEISIGNITKTMSSGDITFDAEQNAFMFPITQQETFALRNTPQKVQIRVKYASGDVYGVDIDKIDVAGSISKAVL